MPPQSDSGDDWTVSVPLGAFPEPAAAVEIDADGLSFVAWNDAFADRFQVDRAMSPDQWWDHNGLGGRGVNRDTMMSALRTGEQFAGTIKRTRTDGDAFRLRIVAGNGGDTRYLFVRGSHDVDGRNSDIDWMASFLSHDLRNPLDVAKANLVAAQETGDAGHFETVARAHDRIELIIEDVLTLARSGGTLDKLVDVDLERVAAAAWDTVETDDGTLSMCGVPERIEGDADRLQRLLENLFRNSVEHAGENVDGAEVEVRLGTLNDGDGFYVADNGPGIDADERDRVFEPGYTDRADGTGLGLSIVERIAAAHGWRVSLTRSASGGARFEFQGMA